MTCFGDVVSRTTQWWRHAMMTSLIFCFCVSGGRVPSPVAPAVHHWTGNRLLQSGNELFQQICDFFLMSKRCSVWFRRGATEFSVSIIVYRPSLLTISCKAEKWQICQFFWELITDAQKAWCSKRKKPNLCWRSVWVSRVVETKETRTGIQKPAWCVLTTKLESEGGGRVSCLHKLTIRAHVLEIGSSGSPTTSAWCRVL